MIRDFRVQLDVFRGPLDLLLYLARKQELDLIEIPISLVTGQFLEYLDVLQELDINGVGEFVELASLLMEMKSRLVLPTVEVEEESIDDPREELVERLLEYKKYRDAAVILDEQSRAWQDRCQRVANDLPPRQIDIAEQPIHEVELWDLVSAMGRILRETQQLQPSNIVYDETPIHVYMTQIHEQLCQQPRLAFSDLLQSGMHKSAMIGVFLAILELMRHHNMTARQDSPHAEIWMTCGEGYSFGSPPTESSASESMPRLAVETVDDERDPDVDEVDS
jgi:segregation and condensation protein A